VGSIRQLGLGLAQDLGPLAKTFFIVWIEDAPSPTPHDVLYVNRILCVGGA
jgi:hypothetical protein